MKKKAGCCCDNDCCQCNRIGEACCYHPDDILTLVISVTYPNQRYCSERCGDNDGLVCDVCTNFLDSRDYALTACGGIIEWTRINEDIGPGGNDTCFPKYIRRECGDNAWIPYDDLGNDRAWTDFPTCSTCEPDCDTTPTFCSNIDSCDLSLICDSDGEASIGSPPPPYGACSHDDGDSLVGSNICLCIGFGCYSLDVIYWVSACVFEETSPGSCFGDGTEAQRTAEGEVTFTIERHCDYSAEYEACLPI